MEDSSASDEILGSPPDDVRCIKNDGKLWRCDGWKMQGKSLCQRHFLKQIEYKSKKKTMPAVKQQKGKKRKSPCYGDDLDEGKSQKNISGDDLDEGKIGKKKNKKQKKNTKIRSTSSEDDSIDKLFDDNYPSNDDDDSIEKLFEDTYPSSSDDSCQLITRADSKVKKMPAAKVEVVKKLKSQADSTPGS